VGVESFHTDGRADMTNLKVAFCNFANAPKNNGNAVSNFSVVNITPQIYDFAIFSVFETPALKYFSVFVICQHTELYWARL
jgi:hypothetical protein